MSKLSLILFMLLSVVYCTVEEHAEEDTPIMEFDEGRNWEVSFAKVSLLWGVKTFQKLYLMTLSGLAIESDTQPIEDIAPLTDYEGETIAIDDDANEELAIV